VVELTLRAGLQPRARMLPRRKRAEGWNLRRMIETPRGQPIVARLVSFPLLSRATSSEGRRC
jgi:hypothetical protein